MFVGEYEDILRQLADEGVDVNGFEIPDEAIPGLEDGYRNCDRDFFDMRLATVMVHISTHTGKGVHPDSASVERIMNALDAWKNDDVPF